MFHGGLNVNEGLIFRVAENGGIRNRQSVGDRSGMDGGGDVHIFLQFLAGIFGDDARLQSARGGIERRGDVGNSSVKGVRISVGGDFDGVAGMHESDFALIDIDENPNGAHVGDGEELRGAGLQQLAGARRGARQFLPHGSEDGDLRSGFGRIFRERFGIVDAQDAKGVFAGLEIGLGLGAVGFGLLKVGFGDGAVSEEVLRAIVELVGEEKRSAGFEVGGARGGVVRAVDSEQRLARRTVSPGATRISWTGPPMAEKTGVVLKAL